MNFLRIAFVTALVMVVVSTITAVHRATDVAEGDAAGAFLATPGVTSEAPASRPSAPTPAATATATPDIAATLPFGPPSVPAESSTQGVQTAAPARLTIPRIGVFAPIVELPLRADGTMPAPSGPIEVASYPFAAKPGEAGNVVLAGHVDFANYGPAVFSRLRELQAGDEVTVTTTDGGLFTYRVSSVAAYDEATAPVAEILGPTSDEVITLITCAGTFDPAVRSYDQRLVVRAERAPQ